MAKLSPDQANDIADALIEEARAESDRRIERREARSARAMRARATLLPVVAAAGTAAATTALNHAGAVPAFFVGMSAGLTVSWFSRTQG